MDTQEKTKPVNRVWIDSSYSPDIKISDKILSQIRFLCNKFSTIEWSGILFYTVKGSLQEKDFEITLQHILLMDVGVASYTEYKTDDSVVDFIMTNKKALSWKMAHIHSHNNMKAYFSGTDKDELMDNAFAYDFYLSVVVNNAMDIVAKIVSKIIESNFKIRDAKGATLIYKDNRELFLARDCNIITNNSVSDAFIIRAEEIGKIRDEKTKKLQPKYFNDGTTPHIPTVLDDIKNPFDNTNSFINSKNSGYLEDELFLIYFLSNGTADLEKLTDSDLFESMNIIYSSHINDNDNSYIDAITDKVFVFYNKIKHSAIPMSADFKYKIITILINQLEFYDQFDFLNAGAIHLFGLHNDIINRLYIMEDKLSTLISKDYK